MKKRIVLAVVVFLLLFIFGCQPKVKKKQSPVIIKIAALYPFSGTSESSGKDSKRGIELAADIINQKYDLSLPLARTRGIPGMENAKIQIIFADHKGDPAFAAYEVERLVREEKVSAIIGSYNSAITAAASEKAEALKIPFLNPDSTSPDLNMRGFTWFFRITPADDMFAENFFSFLQDLEGQGFAVPKSIALVHENGLWGTGVARAEEKYAMRNGFDIVADIPYNADTGDVEDEVSKLLALKAEIIMQASYANDAILFIKEYSRQNISPKAIIGMDAGFISSSFIESLKQDAELVFSREVWALDLGERKPLVTTIDDLFFDAYHVHMNGNSARSFTGVFVLADAINRAGSTKPDAIRIALKNINMTGNDLIMPWEGIAFDENNQNTLGRGIIVQVQDGRYHTVWPFALAARDIIWPMPAKGKKG